MNILENVHFHSGLLIGNLAVDMNPFLGSTRKDLVGPLATNTKDVDWNNTQKGDMELK